MERLGLASAALVSAALLGASAPSIGGNDDAAQVSARALSGNQLVEARLTDVNGRASGHIERVFLDETGDVAALRVRWRAGLTEDTVLLEQPIERFSYNPAANHLVTDAGFETLRRWSDEDRTGGRAADGVAVAAVGPGLLNGAVVNSRSGERLGRVVEVIESEAGEPATLVIASRSGWLDQRVTRRAVPVDGAMWIAAERAVTISDNAGA